MNHGLSAWISADFCDTDKLKHHIFYGGNEQLEIISGIVIGTRIMTLTFPTMLQLFKTNYYVEYIIILLA